MKTKITPEVNEKNVIPNGTILIKGGHKYEVMHFRAEYTLKEVGQQFDLDARRLNIGIDNIRDFKVFEEGKENRTYEELEASVESLQYELRKANKYMDADFIEKEKLKDEIKALRAEKKKR